MKENKRSGSKRPYTNKKRPNRGSRKDYNCDPAASKGAANGSEIPESNDWRFYAVSEQEAKAVASFPFNVLAGRPIDLQWKSSADATNVGMSEAGGAVMMLDYMPSIGRAGEANDAANIAARRFYTYIRHANSGAKVYEAPDLMMYFLAMIDIIVGYFHAKRDFGIIQTYSRSNRNMPNALMTALGLSSTDVIGLANYNFRLNVIANRINSFCLPKDILALQRFAYIASNVFIDASTIRGQFYIFHKKGYYVFQPVAEATGSSLKYMDDMTPANLSLQITHLETQLNALFGDDDINTMSGDVLKAFKENVYNIAGVPSDYMIEPVYDEDILNQIQNASLCGVTVSEASLSVTQANNVIKFQPQATDLPNLVSNGAYIFNSHKDDPQYTDNIEWSRLYTIKDGSMVKCGLECLIQVKLVASTGATYTITRTTMSPSGDTDWNSLLLMSQFDWHPFMYLFSTSGAAPNVNLVTKPIFGDLRYYAILDKATISRTHDSAVLAAYYGGELYGKTETR